MTDNPLAVLVNSVVSIVVLVWWFLGISISSGWYAVLATVFPPYAMYVVVDHAYKLGFFNPFVN